MNGNKYRNILIIIIGVTIMAMIYLFLKNKNTNKNNNFKNNQNMTLVETMTVPEIDVNETSNGSKQFCIMHQDDSANLETKCSTLTKSNCKKSECCTLVDDYKCMAGSADGPVFKYDKFGKSIPIDTYFYMNKCYGPGCTK